MIHVNIVIILMKFTTEFMLMFEHEYLLRKICYYQMLNISDFATNRQI